MSNSGISFVNPGGAQGGSYVTPNPQGTGGVIGWIGQGQPPPPQAGPPAPGAFGAAPPAPFDPTLLYWGAAIVGGGAFLYFLISLYAKPKGAR